MIEDVEMLFQILWTGELQQPDPEEGRPYRIYWLIGQTVQKSDS